MASIYCECGHLVERREPGDGMKAGKAYVCPPDECKECMKSVEMVCEQGHTSQVEAWRVHRSDRCEQCLQDEEDKIRAREQLFWERALRKDHEREVRLLARYRRIFNPETRTHLTLHYVSYYDPDARQIYFASFRAFVVGVRIIHGGPKKMHKGRPWISVFVRAQLIPRADVPMDKILPTPDDKYDLIKKENGGLDVEFDTDLAGLYSSIVSLGGRCKRTCHSPCLKHDLSPPFAQISKANDRSSETCGYAMPYWDSYSSSVSE